MALTGAPIAAADFRDPDALLKEIFARSPRPPAHEALAEAAPHFIHAIEKDVRAYLHMGDLDLDDERAQRSLFNEVYAKFMIEPEVERDRREERARAVRRGDNEVDKYFVEELSDKLPRWRKQAARNIIASTKADTKLLESVFRVGSVKDLPAGLLPLSDDAAAFVYKVCVLVGKDNESDVRTRVMAYMGEVCALCVRHYSEQAEAQRGTKAATMMRDQVAEVQALVKAGGISYSQACKALENDKHRGQYWAKMPYGDGRLVAALDLEMRVYMEEHLFVPLAESLRKACEGV